MRLYKREEYFKSQRGEDRRRGPFGERSLPVIIPGINFFCLPAAMEDAADLCTEFYRAAGEPMPADMDWQTQPAAAAAAGTDTV